MRLFYYLFQNNNVENVIQRLNDVGMPYEVLTFEDEGHGISKTANQRTLFMRLVSFFEQALSGDRFQTNS